jgi:8-oxo-dGTP pyrophosphatase MutT (NUDIX family)
MADGSPSPKQVAVIAVRRGPGLEICLIRRKDASEWAIPKGFIDPGDTPEQAALTEAVEEAGLLGQITGAAVGLYEYVKFGSPLTVAVFVMDVIHEQDTWREMRFRERRWFSLDAAASELSQHPVGPLWSRIRESLEASTP